MQLSITSPIVSTYDIFPFESFSLVANGTNHDIIDCGIYESLPILVKIARRDLSERQWTRIQQMYRICNELIQQQQQAIIGLVPTYGFLVCPSPLYKPCGLRNVTPRVQYMVVQHRLYGATLQHYMREDDTNDTCTMSQLQEWLQQLFSILVQMEQSPVQLYHNDLHPDNIFIESESNRVYLLDMEVAECWIDGKRTTLSPNKKQYCGTTIVLSGAYDMYLLCYQLAKSSITEIATMAQQKVEVLLSQFSLHHPLSHPWLYTVLEHDEKKENDVEKRKELHSFHTEVLQRMTYGYCIALLFPNQMNIS